MRIFFIHQFYRTPEEGGGIRSWYVTRALQKAGHEVIVITGQNSEYADKYAENSVDVIRLPVSWSNSMRFWQRIKAFFKFLYLARKESKRHDFDLVYAVSVPLTTGLLAIWTKKPFVFEVGDLWPDAPVQMGIIKNPILKYFSYKLEKRIYQKAQLIISLSEDIQKHIYQKWPNTANVVVENFSDLILFKKEDKQNGAYFSESEKIICTYVGTAGMANDLMQMVDLAKIAEQKYPQFQFHLMISGKEKEKIKKAAPGNMHFIEYSAKEKVAELLSISDFNFVCYAQYSLLGTGSPNKFFDGLAAECITVINVKGWIEKLILKEEAGLFWNVKQGDELLNQMLTINQSAEEKAKMRANVHSLAKRFDKNKLLRKIVEQIEIRN